MAAAAAARMFCVVIQHLKGKCRILNCVVVMDFFLMIIFSIVLPIFLTVYIRAQNYDSLVADVIKN